MWALQLLKQETFRKKVASVSYERKFDSLHLPPKVIEIVEDEESIVVKWKLDICREVQVWCRKPIYKMNEIVVINGNQIRAHHLFDLVEILH